MLVGEVLVRKENIEKKILEYKNYLNILGTNASIDPSSKGDLYSQALTALFDLLNKLQSHNALLDSENTKNTISLGEDKKMSVLDAVHVRKTLVKKIKIFDNIISKNDLALSVNDLMTKRDALNDELIAINIKIKESDWSTEI